LAGNKLPEGLYRGQITEWGFGKSQKGTPYFEVTAALTGGYNHDEGEFDLETPVRRTAKLYLSPAAMEMSAAAIRSLGFEGNDLRRLNPEADDPFDLSGKAVTFKVYHEEYVDKDGNDAVSEKVDFFRSKRQPAVAVEAVADPDELNALFFAANEKASKGKGASDAPAKAKGRKKK
jgi:hypothetical protein